MGLKPCQQLLTKCSFAAAINSSEPLPQIFTVNLLTKAEIITVNLSMRQRKIAHYSSEQ